jgi:hypothetical protein
MPSAAVPARWWRRWDLPTRRRVALVVTFVGIGWAAALFWIGLTQSMYRDLWGTDIVHYLAATRQWVATGSPYDPNEVAHAFVFEDSTFLHPPISLLLFLPFLALPLPLWWAIPIAVVAWCIRRWRPAYWAWPIVTFLVLGNPRFVAFFIVGNTDLWLYAGICAGLILGWPALVVLVKPSLLVFTVAGAWSRSFWMGLAVVGVACLAFLPLWDDWASVVINSPADLLYSAWSITYLITPFILWAARERSPVATFLEPIGEVAAPEPVP